MVMAVVATVLIMINSEVLKNNFFVNMDVVPYQLKNGTTLEIKPILTKDYLRYEWSIYVLQLNKNEVNDINIIQMSYLDFLNKIVFKQENGQEFKDRLWWIIHLCFGEDAYIIDNNKLIICDKDNTVKHIVNSKEFNEITQIILFQNDFKYDDRYVNPEVKEIMQEYYNIKYKDVVSPDLEKRKAFVSSKTGKTFKEINEMPYREFDLIYNACVDSEIYIGEKIIQGSYKYQCEDIKHPLFAPKKDMYEELFEDTSVLSNKGINGAEQLNAMNLQNNI